MILTGFFPESDAATRRDAGSIVRDAGPTDLEATLTIVQRSTKVLLSVQCQQLSSARSNPEEAKLLDKLIQSSLKLQARTLVLRQRQKPRAARKYWIIRTPAVKDSFLSKTENRSEEHAIWVSGLTDRRPPPTASVLPAGERRPRIWPQKHFPRRHR